MDVFQRPTHLHVWVGAHELPDVALAVKFCCTARIHKRAYRCQRNRKLISEEQIGCPFGVYSQRGPCFSLHPQHVRLHVKFR